MIRDIKDPEFAYPVTPGLRGVSLKLFDVVAPEGLSLELRVGE